MNGKDIFVMVEEQSTSTIIAGTRTNELNSSCGMEEVTSPTTGEWDEYRPKRAKWNVTTGYLILASEQVLDLLKVRKQFTLHIVTHENGVNTSVLTGKAWLSTCKINLSIGKLAQGSFQFTGTGPLEVPDETDPEEES